MSKKLVIPKKARKLIDSVNQKFDDFSLDQDTIKRIRNSYKNNILMEISYERMPKYEVFCKEIGEVFSLSSEEITFLSEDCKNGRNPYPIFEHALQFKKEYCRDMMLEAYALNYGTPSARRKIIEAL